jgi:hypothetical protein
MSESENPFLIDVSVTFTSPSGNNFVVPAFYDGDGSGGLDGNVWRVRFSPNETGDWDYVSTSSEPQLNGHNGTFTVSDPSGCTAYAAGGLPDFGCVGRLQAVNQHYLRFAEGPYWLKGGEDDPEDFLAPGQNVGFSTKNAAIDYLASNGVNSLYMLLHNVGGDEKNVWPWVGDNENEAKENHRHFDVEKLAEWEALFSYMQDKGIVLHFVLEDDSGWTGFDRDLYYREMVARFGHHNGLYWNISEEYNENYSSSQVKSFAETLSSLDAYNHPVTVHHRGDLSTWEPFLNDPDFDLTSFQTNRQPQNDRAVDWFGQADGAVPVIPISFDETGKIADGDRSVSRHIVWSVYMGGGNFEIHTFPLSDYRDFAEHFSDMHLARTFMEGMAFQEMQPANELITDGDGYLFAKPGATYAVYLPGGDSIDLDLSGASGEFNLTWFNPRTGATQSGSVVNGGATRTLTAPDGDDWALKLQRSGNGENVAPLASNSNVSTAEDAPVNVVLNYSDDDGPGPYTFTIDDGPDHGTLTGTGTDRTYTPDAGFTGSDSFSWHVNDGLADSNVATASIEVEEENSGAPVAKSELVQTPPGHEIDIQLEYTDPDNGPGPYTIDIVVMPEHGSLTGANNDWTYTPTPGFAGFDTLQWIVNDGEQDSNLAYVTIAVLDELYNQYLPVAVVNQR